MRVSFTTGDVSPRERVDYWHSISCSTYHTYDCIVQDHSDFGATIDAAPLAALNLSICNNTPLTADRTPRHAAQTDTDSMFFGVILGGTKHIEQDGRQTTVGVGDCYLVDAGRPYVLTNTESKSELVLEIPRPLLEARTGCSADARARHISGRKGAVSMMTSFLRELRAKHDTLGPAASEQFAVQAVDLVALALTDGAPETVRRIASAASVSRLRLHDAIEACVRDYRVHCPDIADMAGMSRRYANILLAQQGTSLERLLIRRRLEIASEMLGDPDNASRSIGDIAASAGFGSASHFARTFKETYGVTARDYRRESAAGHVILPSAA